MSRQRLVLFLVIVCCMDLFTFTCLCCLTVLILSFCLLHVRGFCFIFAFYFPVIVSLKKQTTKHVFLCCLGSIDLCGKIHLKQMNMLCYLEHFLCL